MANYLKGSFTVTAVIEALKTPVAPETKQKVSVRIYRMIDQSQIFDLLRYKN